MATARPSLHLVPVSRPPGCLVREATAADRELVISIVGEMWQADVRERYDWLYAGNPHGRALTWLALEGGVPVAITSLFPRRVRVDGLVRVGSIGGDCYVLPRARRRGLATQLHVASMAGMHAHGVDFMYGPPRPNNLQALLKAGSHDVTMFRRWTRPLTGDAVPTLRQGPLRAIARLGLRVLDRVTSMGARSPWTLERITSFGSELVRGLEVAATTHRILPVRDAAWLSWRYLEGPSRMQIPYAVKRAGELVGYVVLEARDGRGVVVDVGVPADPDALDATIELVLAEARELGCTVLDASFTPGAPIAHRLWRHGFVGREEHGFQVALAADSPPTPTLLDASAWTFSDGDKDMDTVFSTEPDA